MNYRKPLVGFGGFNFRSREGGYPPCKHKAIHMDVRPSPVAAGAALHLHFCRPEAHYCGSSSYSTCAAFCSRVVAVLHSRGLWGLSPSQPPRAPPSRPPPAPPPSTSAYSAPPAEPPCSASLGLRWWRLPRRTPVGPAPSPLSLDSGEPRREGVQIRLDLEQKRRSSAVGQREAAVTGEGGGGGESTPLQVSFTGLLAWIRCGRFLPFLSSTSS
jgi:hypothetical protein